MNEEKETVEDVKVEETGDVGTQANENKDEGKAEKTYTQEEYNALDKKLKAKYEKKYSGIDIAKYNEWVESQKTAEQKQAEREKEYLEKDNTISELLKENSILKAGIKNADDVDYILFKVNKMDGEFDENLAKFLEENPKFLEAKELAEPRATGAPVKTIGSNEEDGVLSILKKKHPEINL